jgi:tetratricopeptide (TPR) repeat protein
VWRFIDRESHAAMRILFAMKILVRFLLVLLALPVAAQSMDNSPASTAQNERLGTVSFPVSCAVATQKLFNRGVALLHDFWYEEAQAQFYAIAKSDPACAMAHWGVAMSVFHQIWNRPSADDMKLGWTEIEKAQSLKVGTDRERGYIAALAGFYHPGPEDFPARVQAYSAAMGKLYAGYPDVDTGAFYALSLLSAEDEGDTSLAQQRKAMAVLGPLFVKYPDNPGVVHYVIHSCDNPEMAREGLAAANRYGEIASSGAHAVHMPGHIYARVGMWPEDIKAQLGSIAASQAAEARGETGIMDEPHSYDFLVYAYLQSGQDDNAKAALGKAAEAVTMITSMPSADTSYMAGEIPYYRTKLPLFYALERRDWKAASAIEPVAGSPPEVSTMVYWARAIGHGHQHQAEQARDDLAKYDGLIAEIRKGANAYVADGKWSKIERGELVAWTAFAEGNQTEAVASMRAAADLQDKVGQGEVDIPAREMLGDILLESGDAKAALAEYEVALKLSPNRLNGLYGAGRAAEAVGDRQKAEMYYMALMKSTNNGENSTREELAHARSFMASTQQAAK